MHFHLTPLPDVCVIEVDYLTDDRGGFARTWSQDEFSEQGLNPAISQCSISFNQVQGTLRGMHFQAAPHAETKLVRVTRGSIFDVALDLREDSPTFLKWYGIELTADDRRMLYIPAGCAHGFQTLEDETEIFYQISSAYEPSASRGVRWDDPVFGIQWPLPVTKIHPRDAAYPSFQQTEKGE